MKRIFTLCTLLLALCILFTSCGDGCEHTYDNDCDIACNTCGEERETAGHQWKAATCTASRLCTVCGTSEGEPLGHTPAEDGGDCTTGIACTVCGAVTAPAKTGHTPAADDGDCTTPVACTECGHTVLSAKSHVFTGEPRKDADGHFYVCRNTDCTVAGIKESHTMGDDGKCTVCEYVLKELHPDGTSSIVMPGVFEQAISEDTSAVDEYKYMIGEAVTEGGTEDIRYNYVPAIITFRIRNNSNRAIVLNSVRLRLVDESGTAYPIASREVTAEKNADGIGLAYSGTYDEIRVTVGGKAMEAGDVYLAYALALALPSDRAFDGKNIELVIETGEHEFVSFALSSSILAQLNPSSECNWAEGKEYIFHGITNCHSGCSFDENGVCTVCGTICSHETDADDGDCTTPVECKECGKSIIEGKQFHTYGEVSYTWSDGYAACTAERSCTADGCQAHESETVNTSSEDGIIFVAEFSNAAFGTKTADTEIDVGGVTASPWVPSEGGELKAE